MKKIVVVGAGNVGATLAYTGVLNRLCSEIVLIDAKSARAQAEALDIGHCAPMIESGVEVYEGNYQDCKDADIVVITAAARVKFGETRLDMVKKNVEIMDSIMPEILASGFNGSLIVVTNPVDVITGYIQEKYQLDAQKVIGTGTVLDTARLLTILSKKYTAEVQTISGICMGEHGDAMVIPWSQVSCNGKAFELSVEEQEELKNATIQSAYDIMKGKGNTSYGIANAVITIIKAVASEEGQILSVSALCKGEYGVNDIYVSVPAEVSSKGVKVVEHHLTQEEREAFVRAAQVLKETKDKVIE